MRGLQNMHIVRPMSILAVVTLVATGLALPALASSQSLQPQAKQLQTRSNSLRGRPVSSEALANRPGSSPVGRLGSAKRTTQVMLELEDSSTVQVFARAKARGSESQAASEATAQRSRIETAQQRVLQRLGTLGAKTLYRTKSVYNGIAVQVETSKLAALAKLPGVKAVHALVPKKLDNASSVPLIGAPQVWNSAGLGATGKGVKIGIIDTGIDYIHTDFGGSGLAADYERNDTTVISDNDGFPNARVVGGTDLVGDDYDANNTDDPAIYTPKPDPDPIDCNGHGSHVAGTAAGSGVAANGTTYTGPYNASINFGSFKIGPGVAPEASLYAIRVFGCEGSTNVVAQALDYAVDPNGDGNPADHLDVVNMSLGSDYGAGDDPDSVASDNAVLAGVTVAVAAGNAGDTYYIAGSPGNAPRVITAASSVDSTDVFDGFRVDAPPAIAGVYPSTNSSAYAWPSPTSAITGTLAYPASQPDGCAPFNATNAALIAGKIALLDWTDGACGSAARGRNAVAAGAIGVILAYNHPIIDIAIAGVAQIPMTLTEQQTGEKLKANLASGIIVTLSAQYINGTKIVNNDRIDTLSSFSSRGPASPNSALKPDISAPGQSIFSAQSGSGTEGVSENGTSMATPHIAGTMALLRQLHPTWTAEELKALAMNTATHDLRSDLPANAQIYGPARVGAGRVDVANAGADSVLAYNGSDPGTVSVSFGTVEVTGTATFVKSIIIANKGTASQSYNLAYAPVTTIPGVTYNLSAATVTVPASGTITVSVIMTANAAQMQHTRDATVADTQLDEGRNWLSEASGYVTATPVVANTAPSLRVPVYVAARPASIMQAQPGVLTSAAPVAGTIPTSATLSVALTGKGLGTGLDSTNVPTDVLSIASAFELQLTSPQVVTDGLGLDADLAYVGVSSATEGTDGPIAPTAVISGTSLLFGIATHGNWATPNNDEFDIYIDTNGSGIQDDGTGAEYVLYNTDLGTASGTDATDVFVTVLVNLESGDASLTGFVNNFPGNVVDTAIYNSNVMALGVSAGDLGLTDTNSRINYRVFSFNNNEGLGQIDDSGTLSYDAATPGLDLTNPTFGASIYEDLPGTSIKVGYNRQAYFSNQSRGLLLLHHHNASGARAQAVTLQTPSVVFLPLITK